MIKEELSHLKRILEGLNRRIEEGIDPEANLGSLIIELEHVIEEFGNEK
tara:strand:+ start:90 stop:236 length:147 start_codon:yes stop_codon:yes gene_type:complete